MAKTKEQLRAAALTKRNQIQQAYADLVAVASDVQSLKILNVKGVRTLIGANAIGLSQSIIRNLKHRRLKQIRRQNLLSAAVWIKSLVQPTYPQVEVDIQRGNVVKVYLRGKPDVEIE